MRRLKQSPDAPSVRQDLPGGDRVVSLDLEVEDRAGIQAQPVAYLLGQRELSLAGQRGEQERSLSGWRNSLHSIVVRRLRMPAGTRR